MFRTKNENIENSHSGRFRQIQAVMNVRDIETIKLFDLSEDRANSVKETLQYKDNYYQSQGVAVEVCKSLEECLWDSDVVTTLTPSRKPIIKARECLKLEYIIGKIHSYLQYRAQSGH